MILHAGPPIEWKRMCGPMRGAIIGAILFEGWADDIDAARKLAESGAYRASNPATTMAPSGRWPASSARRCRCGSFANGQHGNRAFCNLNEGLGKVLRFGANGPEVLDAPASGWRRTSQSRCAAGLDVAGPIELKPLMAQALHMGDEVHNRNAAATSLLLKRLAPALLASKASRGDVAEALAFIAGNDHFFLNLSMAACKAMLDAAHGVAGSRAW